MPQCAVFAAVTDFAHFERRAKRADIAVRRLKDVTGHAWFVEGSFRGHHRQVAIVVTDMVEPDGLRVLSRTQHIDFQGHLRLTSIGSDRTRLQLDVSAFPKTITGRFLVQALRLSKARLSRELDAMLRRFCDSAQSRARFKIDDQVGSMRNRASG